MPGIARQRRDVLRFTHSANASTLMPESSASAIFGPMPETFSRLRNRRALVLGREAVQQVRVLAHDEMGEQADVAADCRQRKKVDIGASSS